MTRFQQKLLVSYGGLTGLLLCVLSVFHFSFWGIVAAVISVTIFSLGMSVWLGEGIIAPIRQMREFTRALTKGDFTRRIRSRAGDDLGRLADDLQVMAEELQKKIIQITHDKNELTAILASMVEGVMVIGKDERIVLLNAPVARMLDLRSKEVTGRLYWEIIRHEEVYSLIKKVFLESRPVKQALSASLSNETYFSVTISPVLDEQKNVSVLVLVFHDITEAKGLEKMRSEFVANVSHELKTPLTSIKGFVETLRDGALSDPQTAQKFLGIIQNHTERLENLVNDLLVLSQVESQEIQVDFTDVNLKELWSNVIGFERAAIERKQQAVSLDIAEFLPAVWANAKQIEQVFINLLENAIKYTPPQGKIMVSAQVDGNYIRVEVCDTGIGIDKEHLSRIFERFYRVDKGRSRELGGTGLGLSIVKHIVQNHSGKVSVQSEPEKGSIFTVFLPQAVR